MTTSAHSSGPSKSLQRRLFGSHLLVIVVALGVLLLGVAAVVLLIEGVDARNATGRQQQSGPIGLFFGLGAAMVASAIVSWRVTRRIVKPLEDISAMTRELAGGRYSVRVPGADTEELNRVADDINQLAEALETTEQRRLRLLGDVAHELRNPLSTIEGTMEAVLDGVVEADDATISRVGKEASRLRRLADDLSSLSSAGELTIVTDDAVDVAALAKDVVAQLEPQSSAKGLDLTIAAEVAQLVNGDADRLTQVLTNVIGNAVQYTEAGSIEVRVASEGGTVVAEVEDTGRGLAAEDLDRIFERFHRVDGHFSDGTGVGLAIAKLLVEGHGGRISATSAGVGSGSTFRVELPGHRR